jgi:hypothetical protein
MHREMTDRGPRRGPIVILAVLVLLAAGFWFFFYGPGQDMRSAPGSTVAEFEGTGAQTTSSFTVREGWQIHWDSSGDSFTMAIRGDRDFGTVVELDEPTSGITAPTGSGSFFLEISADGEWTATVIQGN